MLEHLTTTQRDALTAFKRHTIMFPLFNNAYGDIKTAFTLSRETGIVQNYLVLGQSGCGKSTLCQMICSEQPRFEEPERTVVPVLYVSVPPLATVSSLAEALLVKIGDPVPYKGKHNQKTGRLIQLIKKCGVQMIIIDELQHVHDRGQYPTIAKVADWIKNLEEEVSIPFIMAGLPRAEILLDANDQLRRRFSAALSLDRMVIDEDDVQAAAFIGVVAELLSAMRIRSKIDINDISAIERIYYATDGRIGYLVSLLLRAMIITYSTDRSAIDLEVLGQAFTSVIWRNGVDALNPFSPKFGARRLSKKGEPFADVFHTVRRLRSSHRSEEAVL